MTRQLATPAPISRYPISAFDDLPDDIRARILKVQEKSGFVPNVFLALAYQPDEFRPFFAYHDALMDKDGGLLESRARDDRRRHQRREPVPLLRRGARRDPAHPREEPAASPTRWPSTTASADITPRQRAMLDFAMKVGDCVARCRRLPTSPRCKRPASRRTRHWDIARHRGLLRAVEPARELRRHPA